jgi:hypothetical protein
MVKAIVGQKMPKMPKFNLSALYSPIEKFGEKIGIIGIFPKRAKRASPPPKHNDQGEGCRPSSFPCRTGE